jgi:hypothetical protein
MRLLIRDLNFGLMLGSCITTMLLLMRCSLSRVLGQKISREIGTSTTFTNLTPCDFWLFPKLKTTLKGQRFSYTVDIQGHVTNILKSIPEEGFQQCFEQWKQCLPKCAAAQEDHFKGHSNYCDII